MGYTRERRVGAKRCSSEIGGNARRDRACAASDEAGGEGAVAPPARSAADPALRTSARYAGSGCRPSHIAIGMTLVSLDILYEVRTMVVRMDTHPQGKKYKRDNGPQQELT
jgi:hypothetical protein